MSQILYNEWESILSLEKSSAYLFRTRLQRTIKHTLKYAKKESNTNLELKCNEIMEKLRYISDHSNQTSTGSLNSFLVLKNDMNSIKHSLV